MTTKKSKLSNLVETYANEKNILEDYKKRVDNYNLQIKDLMSDLEIEDVDCGDYNAKIIIQNRVTMDEDKLLSVLKTHGVDKAIRTREYVDMDILESMLYNNELPKNIVRHIGKCKNEKQVKTLRVTKNKK